MSAETRTMNTTDLSNEQLDRLAFTLAAVLSKKGLWLEQPMGAKEAMVFLGVGKTRFYRLENLGVIKPHKPDPDGHPFYYPSEMNEGIRKAVADKMIRKV